MVLLAALPQKRSEAHPEPFFSLFPHRFDYIYAPHPEPGISPAWQTETRHPLTDRLLEQGSFLYGVRFGKQAQYCLLDIDKGSPYHPATDPFAIQRIVAALEPIGLTDYLACTSSYSGGLHLYFPFQTPQNTWELGAAITALLETAGLTVKPGLLETFPNRKGYSIQAKPSLFNAHRLPLQAGSYLLNRDLEPVWSDCHRFVQQWQTLQQQNEIISGSLKRVLKRQRKTYQISGKAAKFLNDLNTEIELGWSDHGQTNYLLGRIAMRTYVFHHILESSAPLEGQALIDQIVSISRSLPGYEQWCQHQHEIEHRASEWAHCVENSHYFHYGSKPQSAQVSTPDSAAPSLSWNQQQSQAARDRIKQAIANLLDQNALPVQASARFKILTNAGIGGGSLYRHKDLWHPDFLSPDPAYLNPADSDFSRLERSDLNSLEIDSGNSLNLRDAYANFTNLFPSVGGNSAQHQGSSDLKAGLISETGGNALPDQDLQLGETIEPNLGDPHSLTQVALILIDGVASIRFQQFVDLQASSESFKPP